MVIANHAYILLEDNSLYAIGDNDYGQCGNSDIRTGRYFNPVKIIEDILDVSVGEKHGIFIDWKGRLLTVGYNKYGQCGTTNPYEDSPQEVVCKIGSTKAVFLQCSAGSRHSAAVDTNGNLWMCGSNDFGQLGPEKRSTDRNVRRHFEVVEVLDENGTPVKFSTVSCGDTHTIALSQDQTRIYSWGNNTESELGVGHAVFERGPVLTLEAVAEEVTTKLTRLRDLGQLSGSYVNGVNYIDNIQWFDVNNLGEPIDENGDVVYNTPGDSTSGVVQPISNAPEHRFGKNKFTKVLTIGKTNLALEMDGTLWVWGFWGDQIHSWPKKVMENIIDFKMTGGGIYILAYNDDVTTNVYRAKLPEWRNNLNRKLSKENELIYKENQHNKVKRVTSTFFLKVENDQIDWERVY